MSGYIPLNVKSVETGLVQNRQEFILPDDAFPVLENAFLFREQIRRKQGFELLGRLRRIFANQTIAAVSNGVPFNIYSAIAAPITPEPNAQIQPGSVLIELTPVPITNNVTGYTQPATDCQVYTASTAGLATGDQVTISGVVVVPGSGDNRINGGPYTIELIDATSFKLGVSSDTWGTWQSGGTWLKVTSAHIMKDQGDGTIASVPVNPSFTGVINYLTGNVTLAVTGGPYAVDITFAYFPGLPAMGLRTREVTSINDEMTVAWDTIYAYCYVGGNWQEFLPGTTWTGNDSQFFWTTNYWTDKYGNKIFWATNNNDPIRYTNGQNGTNWINFSPQVDSAGHLLINALAMLPFRGRMLAFNTLESTGRYTNRIRWAAIGTPFTVVSGVAPNDFISAVNVDAWRDDKRGQGGFLNIPTSEDIIAVGFVRDNLVIYCERSTWQLRYTGRSIAPFQIEKVNSELGAESTFSAVQFDTSLVGIGDKGVVECDSYKSERIDIKIPDLVFNFNNQNAGTQRVHGIRDFVQRVAYWIFPLASNNGIYPDRRLVYNYENDSWAIFTDSLTCLGTYQPQDTRTWANTLIPWEECNFSWQNQPSLIPAIVGGNQQGFIEYIGGDLESGQTTNDQSLFISNIVGHGVTNSSAPVTITSPYHNLQTNQIIQITDIPSTDSFYSYLNNGIYCANVTDSNTFYITKYDPKVKQYTTPALAPSGTYIGGAQIKVRDNFSVTSKKFNYMDDGQSYQLGYIDILMNSTSNGAISLNVYSDYNNAIATNEPAQNGDDDTFFNQVIPTSVDGINTIGGLKNWQRVVCPTRANFVTIEYTLNNEQMQNQCQENDVQIDAQIIWSRPAGRMNITQ